MYVYYLKSGVRGGFVVPAVSAFIHFLVVTLSLVVELS